MYCYIALIHECNLNTWNTAKLLTLSIHLLTGKTAWVRFLDIAGTCGSEIVAKRYNARQLEVNISKY